MAEISWGKCTIVVGKYDANKTEFDFTELGTVKMAIVDTPVNSSTTINIDEGEKHEAEIEGGSNEAVRSDDDKISVEFDIRRAKGRKVIAGGGKIGQIDGTYMLGLQPENPAAPSILVEAASLKRTISYNSADGIFDHYVFDALVPKVGQPVKIGQLTKAGSSASKNERLTTAPATCEVLQKEKYIGFYEETDSYLI